MQWSQKSLGAIAAGATLGFLAAGCGAGDLDPDVDDAPLGSAEQELPGTLYGQFNALSIQSLPDVGSLSGRDYPVIQGWICNDQQPASQAFDLYASNVCLTTGCPNDTSSPVYVGRYVARQQDRGDVTTAGQGPCNPTYTKYGFNMPLPSILDDGRTHTIFINHAGTGTPLGGGPRVLRPGAAASGQFGYIGTIGSDNRLTGWARAHHRVQVYATNTSGDGTCIKNPALPQHPSPPARVCRVADTYADGSTFQVNHPNFTGLAQYFSIPLPGYLLDDDPQSPGDSHQLYVFAFQGSDGASQGKWLPDTSSGGSVGVVQVGPRPLSPLRVETLDLDGTRQSLHRVLDATATSRTSCDQGFWQVPLPPESAIGATADGYAKPGVELAASCPTGAAANPVPLSTTDPQASHLQSYFKLCDNLASCSGYAARLTDLGEGLIGKYGSQGSLLAWNPAQKTALLYSHPGYQEAVNQDYASQMLGIGVGVGNIVPAVNSYGVVPCLDGYALDDDNLDGVLCSQAVQWVWDFAQYRMIPVPGSSACELRLDDARCVAFHGMDPGWRRDNGRRLRFSSDIFVPTGCAKGEECGRHLAGRASIFINHVLWLRRVRNLPACHLQTSASTCPAPACSWNGAACVSNTPQIQITSAYTTLSPACETKLTASSCWEAANCGWTGTSCVRNRTSDGFNADSDPTTSAPIVSTFVSSDPAYVYAYAEPAPGAYPSNYDAPAAFTHAGFDVTYEHFERVLEEACLTAAQSPAEAIACRDGTSARWGRPDDWNLVSPHIGVESWLRTGTVTPCSTDADCPAGEACSISDNKCLGYAAMAATFRNVKIELLAP